MSAEAEFFFKYHGIGNDFIVLDRRETGVDVDAATSRLLSYWTQAATSVLAGYILRAERAGASRARVRAPSFACRNRPSEVQYGSPPSRVGRGIQPVDAAATDHSARCFCWVRWSPP